MAGRAREARRRTWAVRVFEPVRRHALRHLGATLRGVSLDGRRHVHRGIREALRRRCVVAAFEPFADRYQLVISTNGKVPAEALGDAYHVVAVPEFPQMALLRRAAVMITHGGANSVRECLTLGVPMLLYPLGFDQFGHPARAVWRGAGLRIRRVEVASLRDGLTRILTHSCYRLQALRISHEFQVAEETQPAAKCIEAFLPRRAETLSRREMRHDAGTPVPA